MIFHRRLNYIIKRIQAGDVKKKKDLYEETYGYLSVIASVYAADKSEYEDILMASYERMFLYIDKCDVKKGAFNWCCKIVEHVAYDFNKKIKHNVPLEYVSFDDAFDNEMEKLLIKDEVLSLVSTLSEYDRNLIILRFYKDLTFEEMAEILSVKKPTLYKQYTVLLKKLNRILDKQ